MPNGDGADSRTTTKQHAHTHTRTHTHNKKRRLPRQSMRRYLNPGGERIRLTNIAGGRAWSPLAAKHRQI